MKLKTIHIFFISLFYIMIGCKPNTTHNYTNENILSTPSVDMVNVQKTQESIFTASIEHLSKENQNYIKNSTKQSHSIYYIPISAHNWQQNLESVQNRLTFHQWIKKLPNELSYLYFEPYTSVSQISKNEESKHFIIQSSVFNPIEINVQEKNNPLVSFKWETGKNYKNKPIKRLKSNNLYEYLASNWSVEDQDISKAQSISTIKAHDDIYILLLHVISISSIQQNTKGETITSLSYYINPLNINSIQSIIYTLA